MQRVANKRKKGTKKPIMHKKKPVNVIYGTVQRPPVPAVGNNIKPMRPPRNSTFGREFKLRIPLATTGTQVFNNVGIFIYHPMYYSTILTGSINITSGVSTALTNCAAIFREFRVKKILLQYVNTLGTSTAFPPIYFAMDPQSTPTNLGSGSTGAADYINRYQNSSSFDAHVSSAAGYWIPQASSLSDEVDNITKGGWMSSDYITTAPNSGVPGLIMLNFGDSAVLGAPLTTTAGVLDIVYHVEFKIPEN